MTITLTQDVYDNRSEKMVEVMDKCDKGITEVQMNYHSTSWTIFQNLFTEFNSCWTLEIYLLPVSVSKRVKLSV